MEETQGLSPSPLPMRLIEVFFNPGKLFETLREKPLWFGALFVGALLVTASVLLIPSELLVQASRAAILRQGGEVPPFMEGAGGLFKVIGVLGAVLFWFIWAFLLAAVAVVVFAFLFGDEGRYVQYLSVVSHALIISAVGALLTLPLRIVQEDPALTLSLGTFAFFLEEGYPLRVLKGLDLFSLWGYGVMAVGATKIDPRRGFTSALIVFLLVGLVTALLFGIPQG